MTRTSIDGKTVAEIGHDGAKLEILTRDGKVIRYPMTPTHHAKIMASGNIEGHVAAIHANPAHFLPEVVE